MGEPSDISYARFFLADIGIVAERDGNNTSHLPFNFAKCDVISSLLSFESPRFPSGHNKA
jgi:hypothetical protein